MFFCLSSSQDGFPPVEVFDGARVLMALTKPRKFRQPSPD